MPPSSTVRCARCWRDVLGVAQQPVVLPSLKPEDYESEVPEGFDTVGHWWTTREAEALDMLSDPLGTFYADTERLQTISEQRGTEYKWVNAGRAYKAVGIDRVRAFPIALLTEFYPTNP